MIQRFIELGEGYGDLFELCELARLNKNRMYRALIFTSHKNEKSYCSVAIALKPINSANFYPIYICREGIPPESQRLQTFQETLKELEIVPVQMEVKHSTIFDDKELFYQYVTGILRLNHLIPPLS